MLTIWTLQAIKHERLDCPENPCNQSLSYSFADCVHRSVMARAGCQPPWRLVSQLTWLASLWQSRPAGKLQRRVCQHCIHWQEWSPWKYKMPPTLHIHRIQSRSSFIHGIANTHIIIFPRWQKRTLSDSRLEKLKSSPCSPVTRFWSWRRRRPSPWSLS